MNSRLIGRSTGLLFLRIKTFPLWLLCSLTLLQPPLAIAALAPPLLLAKTYQPGINLDDYWVSEKFDGVRGYWDGEKLWTRAGNPVAVPAWFTRGWPKLALDGELWAGYGKFELASTTVRQLTPDDAAWRNIRFMVFDLPTHPAVFSERIPVLQVAVSKLNLPWVQMVRQSKVPDHETLQNMMERTVALGGEGLMLHRGSSLYRGERSDDLLKLKPYEDAEARVIAHLPGAGKYSGMLGALLVEMPDGLQFRLGTGFSNEQRRQPPAVGALVTYRYRGVYPRGTPRFASFVRVRDETILTP